MSEDDWIDFFTLVPWHSLNEANGLTDIHNSFNDIQIIAMRKIISKLGFKIIKMITTEYSCCPFHYIGISTFVLKTDIPYILSTSKKQLYIDYQRVMCQTVYRNADEDCSECEEESVASSGTRTATSAVSVVSVDENPSV